MLNILSDECLFVSLTEHKTLTEVLQSVREIVRKDPQYNVIIDFTKVIILTSRHLSELMMLRNVLDQNGQRLIFCNVPFQIMCEFRVAGLRRVFEFTEDKFSALEVLQSAN